MAGYVASRHVLPDNIRPVPVFNRQIFDEIVSFSTYTFVGNFIGSLVSRADKLLIGILVGTEAVTFYQIPFTIAQMANGIVHTLAHIAFPRFSEMFSQGNQEGLLNLYRTANDIVFLVSMMIAVMLVTVGAAFALFLLMLTVPLQYVWIARHVGHGCLEYLTQVLAFLLGGYSIVYFLENLNTWIGHSLLEILLNGLLVTVTLVVAVWGVLRERKVVGRVGLKPAQAEDW